jgi:flagellar basal body-associated protein FliL
MSDVDEIAPKAVVGRSRGFFRSWKMIAILILLIVVARGGAGYWYFFLGTNSGTGSAKVAEPETPLPFYLEIKPFVVSTASSAGAPHFVQLGPNLTLSGAAAGNAVSAVLPEVQDAMRKTVLNFKADDMMTPAGIDKLRERMIANVNQVLLQRLGADRVKRLNGGEANSGVVQNLYFSTLIVE